MKKYSLPREPSNDSDHDSRLDNTGTTDSKHVDQVASIVGRRADIKDSGDLGADEQEKARLIADGVQAWKKLYSNQQVPDPTGAAGAFAAEAGVPPGTCSSESNPSSVAEASAHKQESKSETSHSTRPEGEAGESRKCPFASTFGSMPTAHPLMQQPISATQRPDCLPTPPDIRPDPIQSTTASKRKSVDFASPAPTKRRSTEFCSPPPSATGSASKCPIRFLDHYSPEEVAEYFRNHKHEIPRSHEVCVKRYQNNAESIRQLDSKYGNLVNMIQGLGAKHQPLLPTKEGDAEEPDLEGKSIGKMKEWAKGVDDALTGEALDPEKASNAALVSNKDERDADDQSNARERHIQRPLKDVRLGESPSRPWGISVPVGDDGLLDTKFATEDRASQASLLQELPRSAAADVGTGGPPPTTKKEEQPRMLFTGPVFIGYGPEQAAALLKATGKVRWNDG